MLDPELPFKPEGSSTASGKKRRKRKSKPTSKARSKRQRIKDRYAHAREDAQLQGLIPTTPEESLTPERVDPSTQGDVVLPLLVRRALRENWATPDSAKPRIIASLLEPFYNEIEVMDKDGNLIRIKPSPKLLIELARILILLDNKQYERDNPEAAGRARGGGNSVSVQMNIAAADFMRGMIERGHIRSDGTLSAPPIASTPGDGGHDGQVEASTAPHDDKRDVGGGVADT